MATLRILRFLGLPAALAVAAAIAGCPAHQAPVQPAPASPAAPAPAAEQPASEPTPLTPSVDSDLDAEDNAAIENLMNSDELAAYMPSDLIHDGGVILYRTMAVRDTARRDPIKDTVKDALQQAALPEPPQDWRRVEGRRAGGRQLTMRKEGGNGTAPGVLSKQARVTVRYGVQGQLVFTAGGGRVTKPFNQVFARTFKFKLEDTRWQLDQLTPLQHESQGGRSGVELERVAIYRGAESTPVDQITQDDRFVQPTEVPTFAPGESVRLEVAASQKNGVPVYVFAYMVGGADRSRVLLKDDGTGGDTTAADGVYTASFAVPTTPGLRHFGVDAINPAAFQPSGLVRSNGVGISFRVSAR